MKTVPHFGPRWRWKAIFEQIVQRCVKGLWEDELHDITGVYTFQCGQCGKLTAHWDIA